MGCHLVRKLSSVAAGAAVLFLTGVPAFAQGYRLEYKFREGNEVRYRISQLQSMEMQMMGQQQSSENSIEQVVRTSTDAVDAEGTGAVRNTVQSIRLHLDLFGSQVDWDSESGEPLDNPMLAPMAEMVGKEVRMSISRRGRIVEFDASDLGSLGGMANPDDLRQTYSQAYIEFPDRELSIGDTFENVVNVPAAQLGQMEMTIRCTLASVDTVEGEQRATINMDIAIAVDTSNSMMPMGGQFEMNGHGTGSMVFSIDRGMVVSSEINNELNMTAQNPQAGNIEMVMNQQVHQELLGSAAAAGTPNCEACRVAGGTCAHCSGQQGRQQTGGQQPANPPQGQQPGRRPF